MVIGCTWLQAVPHVIVWPVHRDKSNAHKLSFITGLHYLFWHKKAGTAEINPWGRKSQSPLGPYAIPHIPIIFCSSIKLFHFEKLLEFYAQRPQTTIILLLAVTWYHKYCAYSGARKVAHGAHSSESSLFYHYRTTHKDLYYCTWINRALHFTHWGHCTWLARGAFFSSFPTAPAEQQEPRHPCHDQMSHSACSWYLSWKASCWPPVVFCAAIFF